MNKGERLTYNDRFILGLSGMVILGLTLNNTSKGDLAALKIPIQVASFALVYFMAKPLIYDLAENLPRALRQFVIWIRERSGKGKARDVGLFFILMIGIPIGAVASVVALVLAVIVGLALWFGLLLFGEGEEAISS